MRTLYPLRGVLEKCFTVMDVSEVTRSPSSPPHAVPAARPAGGSVMLGVLFMLRVSAEEKTLQNDFSIPQTTGLL